MAINKYFEELSNVFDVQGFTHKKWQLFERNIDFDAFLIKYKMQ